MHVKSLISDYKLGTLLTSCPGQYKRLLSLDSCFRIIVVNMGLKPQLILQSLLFWGIPEFKKWS